MQIATPRFGSGLVPSVGALVAIGVTVGIVAAAGFFINQRLNPGTTTVPGSRVLSCHFTRPEGQSFLLALPPETMTNCVEMEWLSRPGTTSET